MKYEGIVDLFSDDLDLLSMRVRDCFALLPDLTHCLVVNGLTREDLTESVIDKACERILEGREISEVGQARLKLHISYMINHYADLFLGTRVPALKEEKPKVEEGCEIDPSLVLDIKPEECKDKEYDWEFLESLGVDKPE